MEMETALLAAPGWDLNDWIQLIVVILLIGGSALGGVAKTLVNTFGGKTSGKEESSSEPAGRAATPRRQPPRDVGRCSGCTSSPVAEISVG